jgi:two-component system cell cycle sensor histidine kinase/response regulator CckA
MRDQVRRLQADRMRSLGELAGGIAHDFNNLLSVILSSSDFLLEDAGPDSPIRPDVEEIRTAAQLASYLTQRLLVLSRRGAAAPKPVDVGELVDGLEEFLGRAKTCRWWSR